jgi:hypothetical protein
MAGESGDRRAGVSRGAGLGFIYYYPSSLFNKATRVKNKIKRILLNK